MTKRFYALCFLSGIAIFVLIYGALPLDVTYDAWILNGYIETDITQRYAGWLAYRESAHFFPLTFSEVVHYPIGGYTSLADSMPLFLVLFKILNPILPQTFQFCGLVCLLNMGLQSLCAGMLISLFTKEKWQVYLGSLLFCFSPVLLERMFRHTSLSFHWLLLLALYYYIKGRRNPQQCFAGHFVVLSVLAVWLHLYFAPMVIGFFFAYALESILIDKSHIRAQVVALVSIIALCVGSAYALGILSMGTGNTSGYGSFGMNLNALFNPVSLDGEWWVPGKGLQDWSRFLPVRALALNNLESFNYLGAGVLLTLVSFGIYLAWRTIHCPKKVLLQLKEMVVSHVFLFLFVAVSTLFAISNTVCAFSYVLITIPLPEKLMDICSAFRSSGRLFWSVNYMLVLLAVVFLCHISKQYMKNGAVLLALLVCVQILDLSPALRVKHESFLERETFYYEQTMDAYMEQLGAADKVFYLMIRDERPLCAALLKEGVANNLWLISRDDYGVAEMEAQIDAATAALKQGASLFENCVYVTYDATLAQELTGQANVRVQSFNDFYFITVP